MLGAKPVQVFIDGYETFKHPIYDSFMSKQSDLTAEKFEHPPLPEIKCDGVPKSNEWSLVNLSRVYVNEQTIIEDQSVRINIKDGKITCIGRTCPITSIQIDAQGGVATPGLVLGYTRLGLEEISEEPVTKDGNAKGMEIESGGPSAVDGLRVGTDTSRMLYAAVQGGMFLLSSVI